VRSMKKTVPVLCLLLLFACSTQKKDNSSLTGINSQGDPSGTVSTGWQDRDTYTVLVTAENEKAAIDRARHRILKDIVRVRIRNGSRYTEITGIQSEFEGPLKRGKVVKREQGDEGIRIYYRIRDKDLRSKFERK